MLKHSIIKWTVWVVLCFFVQRGLASETDHSLLLPVKNASLTSEKNLIHQTYTLQQINGLSGLLFKGTNATNVLYLPVLPQWNLQSIHLHFLLTRATKNATINYFNMLIDNRPISAFELSGVSTSPEAWDVDIAPQNIKSNLMNLTLMNNVAQNINNCLLIVDPNYWVLLEGGSTITYDYTLSNYVPDLRKFPAPFVNKQSLQKDIVTLSAGDLNNVDTIQSVLYVANALGQYETWRGLKLDLTSNALLSSDQKSKTPIIMVGTAKDLQLNSLPLSLPVLLNSDNVLLHPDHTSFSSNEGVLIMAASPWEPTLPLLIVTGNTDEAVKNAALKLRDPRFTNTILYPEYAIVSGSTLINNPIKGASQFTFADIGLETQTVYGTGENSLNYTLDLMRDKSIASVDLTIHYQASALLDKKSYLSLKINDTLVSNQALYRWTNATWKKRINRNDLKDGLNTLSFVFSLNLPHKNCSPEEMSLAWARILKSSVIKINFKDSHPYLYLKSINGLFKNNLLILIDPKLMDQTPLLQQLVNVVKKLKYIDYLMVTNKEPAEADVHGNDIIYIGNENIDFTHLAMHYENKKLIIDPVLLKTLLPSDETPIGIVELLPSTIEKNKLVLYVSAENEANYHTVLDSISNSNKLNLTYGNVLLVYANGTFVSIQSQRLLAPLKSQAIQLATTHWVLMIALVCGLIVGLFAIVWFIYKKIKGRPHGN